MKKLKITTRKKCGKSTKEKTISTETNCIILRRHNKGFIDDKIGEKIFAKSVAVLIKLADYKKHVQPYSKNSIALKFEGTEFKLLRVKDCTELDGIPNGVALSIVEPHWKTTKDKWLSELQTQQVKQINDNTPDHHETLGLAA